MLGEASTATAPVRRRDGEHIGDRYPNRRRFATTTVQTVARPIHDTYCPVPCKPSS